MLGYISLWSPDSAYHSIKMQKPVAIFLVIPRPEKKYQQRRLQKLSRKHRLKIAESSLNPPF